MVDEEVMKLRETVQRGQELSDFREKSLCILEKHILEPLEKQAFATFKKVDPSDTVQVMETQKMSQMIEQIRNQIDFYIEEGKLAVHTLNTLPTEDEYED